MLSASAIFLLLATSWQGTNAKAFIDEATTLASTTTSLSTAPIESTASTTVKPKTSTSVATKNVTTTTTHASKATNDTDAYDFCQESLHNFARRMCIAFEKCHHANTKDFPELLSRHVVPAGRSLCCVASTDDLVTCPAAARYESFMLDEALAGAEEFNRRRSLLLLDLVVTFDEERFIEDIAEDLKYDAVDLKDFRKDLEQDGDDESTWNWLMEEVHVQSTATLVDWAQYYAKDFYDSCQAVESCMKRVAKVDAKAYKDAPAAFAPPFTKMDGHLMVLAKRAIESQIEVLQKKLADFKDV